MDHKESEKLLFRKRVEGISSLPLKERQENGHELLWIINHNIERLYQSFRWLINGDFGYGSWLYFNDILKSRSNKNAWVFINACVLDYSVDPRRATRIWHSLDGSLKIRINAMIRDLIREYEEENNDVEIA